MVELIKLDLINGYLFEIMWDIEKKNIFSTFFSCKMQVKEFKIS